MRLSRVAASSALLFLLAAPSARAQDVVSSPQEQYAVGAVGFESTVVIGPWGGRDWTPYLGKYHRPLDGIAFYEALGRADLVGRYRTRQAVRYTLMLGGIATSVVGLVMFRNSSDGGGWVPMTVFLGGGVVTSVGWYMSPDPLEGSEARQAADIYNKALKRRLGLDGAEPAAVPGQLTLGAFPAPGGVAFSLGGSF